MTDLSCWRSTETEILLHLNFLDLVLNPPNGVKSLSVLFFQQIVIHLLSDLHGRLWFYFLKHLIERIKDLNESQLTGAIDEFRLFQDKLSELVSI